MNENEVQNTLEQDTTPGTAETQQEAMGAETPETAPQDGKEAQQTSAQGGETTAEPFLEIKYNHEKRGLSREEAALLAQKGIHYENTYNAVERFATLKGVTVDEFLSGLETAEDEAYRNSLMERFGGDEQTVNEMMELHNFKKQQTLDNASKSKRAAAEAEEQSVNSRISEEFSKMKEEFPELTEYTALPESVKRAAYEGLSLEHAYLKYKNSEQKRIQAAKQNEAEAAKKSAGAIETEKENGSTLVDSFLSGFRRN